MQSLISPKTLQEEKRLEFVSSRTGVVHLDDLYYDLKVKVDPFIREKVRAPIFNIRERLYRQIRRKTQYCRINGWNSPKTKKVKIRGMPITIEEALEVCTRLKMARRDFETHIECIKSGSAYGAKTLERSLPIKGDEDFAFLIGLFHGCGGINFRGRDPMIRFNVDPDVAEELVRIGRRVGELPRVYGPSHLRVISSSGQEYRRKRIQVSFSRTVESVLVGLGVQKPINKPWASSIGPHGIHGGRVLALRDYKSDIPSWISSKSNFLRSYVEGYLNSLKLQSFLYGRAVNRQESRKCYFEGQMLIRFAGVDEESVKKRMTTVLSFLRSCGITGDIKRNRLGLKRRLIEFEYCVFNYESIKALASSFRILAPCPTARLAAIEKGYEDTLFMLGLSRCDTDSAVLLGALVRGQSTKKEIFRKYRLAEDRIEASLSFLLSLGLVKRDGQSYSYEPTRFKDRLQKETQMQITEARNYLAKMSRRLFYRCPVCDAVTESWTHCGIETKPEPRGLALRAIVTRITKLRNQLSIVSV